VLLKNKQKMAAASLFSSMYNDAAAKVDSYAGQIPEAQTYQDLACMTPWQIRKLGLFWPVRCSSPYAYGPAIRKWADHTSMAVNTNGSSRTMHIVIYLEWAGPIEYIPFIYMFPMQR
jgi:hypothetical protein